MLYIIMLMKKKEMARIVAAAGLMLKQENIKPIDMIEQASTVITRWTTAKRSQAVIPSKDPKIPSSGMKTNRPPVGKKIRANNAPNRPKVITKASEKTAPAIHFSNKSRSRETGRERIILKVPSSASFATKSPPTNATYKGSRKKAVGVSVMVAT